MLRNSFAISIVCCMLLGPFLFGQDAKTKQEKDTRASQIKKEIAELRAKLASLESELSKLENTTPYIGPVKGKGKFSLTLGDKGHFGTDKFEVIKIESDNGAIVRPVGSYFEFLVQDVLTTGLVDGSVVTMPGQWHVASTYKHLGQTRFLVIPVKGREGWNNKLAVVK